MLPVAAVLISFDYGVDRTGKVSLENLTHINLRRFTEAMERLSYFLDGPRCYFEGQLEIKSEMEQAYLNERTS